MGDRYYMTGVQLGVIKGLLGAVQESLNQSHDPPSYEDIASIERILKSVDEVLESQYIGTREQFEDMVARRNVLQAHFGDKHVLHPFKDEEK